MKTAVIALLSITVLLSACDKTQEPVTEVSETEQAAPQNSAETMFVESLSNLNDRLRTVTSDMSTMRDSVVKEVSEQYEVGRTEMSEQIQALSERLDEIKAVPEQSRQTALLDKLDQSVRSLDARVNALENKPAPAPAVKTPVKAEVNTKTETPAKAEEPQPKKESVSKTPPFTVIGTELRGAQTFLSVMPKNQSSAHSVQFLTVGQSIGGWQLTRLTGKEAVFQVGEKHETIELP